MYKVNAVSGNSIEEIISKIESFDFSFENKDRFKAAWIGDEAEKSEIMETISINKDKNFFSENSVFLSCGINIDSAAFLFPGQGSQYVDMGKGILKIADPKLMEKADSIFMETSESDKPLSYFLYKNREEEILAKTNIAQPAIGLISALYIDILQRFNIKPCITCGHSFGEITALYASSSISFEDFIKTACIRGKLMAQCGEKKDPGSMMAVIGDVESIQKVIEEEGLDLIIANQNSPRQNVLSGETEEIEKAQKIFRKNRLRGIKLPVAAAFHSRFVSDAVAPFGSFLDSVEIAAPKIDSLSNTTGGIHGKNPENIKENLKKQITNPVLFNKNMESLKDSKIEFFIEAGPKKVLTDLAKQCLSKEEGIYFVSTDESLGKDNLLDLAKVIATSFVLGLNPDLTAWNNQEF